MAKFTVYQIDGRNHPTIKRDVFMYGHGDIFSADRARQLLNDGVYQIVATVEAVALDHVFELLNMPYSAEEEKAFLKRRAPMHSLSVGDIVVINRTMAAFIVAPIGFDYLGQMGEADAEVINRITEV